MKNKKILKEKGITLIALVITIIVLLILAGVSIAMLTGENGILTQANNAKVEQSHGAVREGIALAYNEYQIEINTASNTKLASTETVRIQGREEKALASYSSFLDFLNSKGYVREGTTDVLNVEKLTGGKQALGNGTDTDIYKIEEQDGNYIVNYYDKDGTLEEIWSIENNDEGTNTEYFIKSYGEDIMLVDKEENSTIFDKAFIFIEDKKIDITSCIYRYEQTSCYINSFTIYEYLVKLGEIPNDGSINGTMQEIEIIKNEKSYSEVVMFEFSD